MKKQDAINGEEYVLLINEHWIKYMPVLFLILISWLIYVLCLGLSIAIRDTSHIGAMVAIITGHALLLAFHHTAFYKYYSIGSRRTLVTSRRILTSDQHPWLSDNVTDTPLWRVQSIEVQKKGILQHLLDYGSLVLNRRSLPTVERVPHPHDAHANIISHVQGMQPKLEKSRTAFDANRSYSYRQLAPTSS